VNDLSKNLRDTADFFDSFPTGVHPQRTLWIRQGADELEALRRVVSDLKILDNSGTFKQHEGEPWLDRVRAAKTTS
jgi:hypothetical protein